MPQLNTARLESVALKRRVARRRFACANWDLFSPGTERVARSPAERLAGSQTRAPTTSSHCFEEMGNSAPVPVFFCSVPVFRSRRAYAGAVAEFLAWWENKGGAAWRRRPAAIF